MYHLHCFLFMVFVCLVGGLDVDNSSNANEKYAVVIDAGSTGSRVFVYKIVTDSNGDRQVSGTNGGKVRPGLSSFHDHLQDAAAYIAPLLINSAALIPESAVTSTELYIKGTAGIRLLPDEVQEKLWDTVFTDLQNTSISAVPLIYKRENFQTITGYQEAFYAVVASNYIAGRIDGNLGPKKNKKIVGALDMGGSSNQLILYNLAQKHLLESTDDTDGGALQIETKDVTSNGNAVQFTDFWSHSFLNYGVERIHEKVLNLMYASHIKGSPESKIIENPCAFLDHEKEHHVGQHYFKGTGDGSKCIDIIAHTLWGHEEDVHACCTRNNGGWGRQLSAEESGCDETSRTACGVDSVDLPHTQGHDFFAMSVYFYAFDCIRHLGNTQLHTWPTPTIAELESAALDFCALTWTEVQTRYNNATHSFTLPHQLSDRCLEGLYMVVLLERGFGFRRDERSITYALEVEGQEVEWTMGFALTEVPPRSSSKSTTTDAGDFEL